MKLNMLLAFDYFSPVCTKGVYMGCNSSFMGLNYPKSLCVVAAKDTSLLIANICIVPLSDEHAKNLETGSIAMLNTSA